MKFATLLSVPFLCVAQATPTPEPSSSSTAGDTNSLARQPATGRVGNQIDYSGSANDEWQVIPKQNLLQRNPNKVGNRSTGLFNLRLRVPSVL
jgi:hypothetical protein